MNQLPKDKKLILFDGVCNLCNSSVQYVIKHDKNDTFRFAALQSELGKRIIEREDINTLETDSIILYSNEDGYKIKSTAALHIARDLDFPINLTAIFLIIPTFIRDWGYNYVAKNRYKWYGKQEHCMIPTPELKAKFLD